MSHVSCIIPFYNGGDTIARAIDSAIGSPCCLEVIVVSDGSPEPLAPNLTESHRDQVRAGKLRIIELASNHGQAAARNMGVSISLGAYLSFLDQDDMYLPGFHEASVAFLETRPQLAALEVGAEFVQDGRIVLDESDPRYPAAISSVPWNIVVRRNLFWACGGFPVGDEFRTKLAGEDIVFKQVLRNFFPVAVVGEKYIRHHIREGSATDRYLKRTRVVDGRIVFTEDAPNETDGSWDRAYNAHIHWAFKALSAELAVTLNQSIPQSRQPGPQP